MKICICRDDEVCVLCAGMDDPDVVAAADDFLEMLKTQGGNH
jgi:hypothetical protein